MPSFKSFRSVVFILSCKHAHPHTYRHNFSQVVKLTISDVNKDWTCKDKDQAYKGQGVDLQGQGLKFGP